MSSLQVLAIGKMRVAAVAILFLTLTFQGVLGNPRRNSKILYNIQG